MRIITKAQFDNNVKSMRLNGPVVKIKRKQFSIDYKRHIVEMHLINEVPISKLSQVAHAKPSNIYLWVKQYKTGRLTNENAIAVSSAPSNVYKVG